VSASVTIATEECADAVRSAAYAEGAAGALGELQRGLMPDALVCGATGWSLIPREDLGGIGYLVIDDRRYGQDQVEIMSRETPALHSQGLVAVRAVPQYSPHHEEAPGSTAGLVRLTGHLRLGLLIRLRDGAHAHLQGRASGSLPLLQQQLVKDLFAEAALDQLIARRQLDDPQLELRSVARAHARLTRASRTLLQLLGASGYLMTGPGALAHVSELAANVFVGRTRLEGEAW
jgi:hypothetical protein